MRYHYSLDNGETGTVNAESYHAAAQAVLGPIVYYKGGHGSALNGKHYTAGPRSASLYQQADEDRERHPINLNNA